MTPAERRAVLHQAVEAIKILESRFDNEDGATFDGVRIGLQRAQELLLFLAGDEPEHRPESRTPPGSSAYCVGCNDPWPCPTWLALNPKEADE